MKTMGHLKNAGILNWLCCLIAMFTAPLWGQDDIAVSISTTETWWSGQTFNNCTCRTVVRNLYGSKRWKGENNQQLLHFSFGKMGSWHSCGWNILSSSWPSGIFSTASQSPHAVSTEDLGYET